jgi:site-specific recombinase XerD
MATISRELELYKTFIERKTKSKNVLCMYCGRTRKFLEQHPAAMTLDETATRELVDKYIENAPVNSAKEVLATAVRYYWNFRFGKRYFRTYNQRDHLSNNSIDNELDAYKSFLVKSKSLAEGTVINRLGSLRRLLYTKFGTSDFSREAVTIDLIRDYLAYSTPQLSLATKGRVATEIRSYAGFLVEIGYSATALAILKLPLSFNYKRSVELPVRIEDSALRTLIDSIKPSSERSARDLALTLLMGNLGLRMNDAVQLTLDDIDWTNGLVTVRNSKSKTPRTLPLDAACGAAIERYVKDFRPKTNTRQIFLVAGNESGEGPVDCRQASRAIRLIAEKAGISGYRGTHTIRRAVATNMVSSGVDIKIVADILGHEHIFTTMGYLRLDLNSLREAAAEWPLEVVCNG